jgi:hypothetical protein
MVVKMEFFDTNVFFKSSNEDKPDIVEQTIFRTIDNDYFVKLKSKVIPASLRQMKNILNMKTDEEVVELLKYCQIVCDIDDAIAFHSSTPVKVEEKVETKQTKCLTAEQKAVLNKHKANQKYDASKNTKVRRKVDTSSDDSSSDSD